MAKLLSEREVVSVRLLTLEISEDELAVYEAALNYLLNHANDAVIDRIVGAYPDEVAAIRDDLHQLLAEESFQPTEELLIQESI